MLQGQQKELHFCTQSLCYKPAEVQSVPPGDGNCFQDGLHPVPGAICVLQDEKAGSCVKLKPALDIPRLPLSYP